MLIFLKGKEVTEAKELSNSVLPHCRSQLLVPPFSSLQRRKKDLGEKNPTLLWSLSSKACGLHNELAAQQLDWLTLAPSFAQLAFTWEAAILPYCAFLNVMLENKCYRQRKGNYCKLVSVTNQALYIVDFISPTHPRRPLFFMHLRTAVLCMFCKALLLETQQEREGCWREEELEEECQEQNGCWCNILE